MSRRWLRDRWTMHNDSSGHGSIKGTVKRIIAHKEVTMAQKNLMPKITHKVREADGRPVETANRHLNALLRALEKAQQDLGARVSEVKGGFLSDHLKRLREGRKLLDALIVQFEINAEQTLRRICHIKELQLGVIVSPDADALAPTANTHKADKAQAKGKSRKVPKHNDG
jgi:hypothetical protein